MIAYLVLLLAVVSRIAPHAWNLTAVGGSLLFLGPAGAAGTSPSP